MELDINQIKEILPHRYPFLLIDRILECEPGKMARARKNVTINEPFFQGHFPGKPVMPGVLLIEAMAQAGAVAMLSLEENKGKIGFMGAVNNAKFKKQVVPGDTLDITVEIIRCKGPIGVGKGTATVDGKIAAVAELTFAIGQ